MSQSQDNAPRQEQKCPDVETLSAIFDKEGQFDPQILEHVKTCQTCGRSLDAFGRLSNGMKCAFASAESPDTAVRIQAGVHEKLKRDIELKQPINFPQLISSIAAALAVCALGAYMVTHMQNPKEQQPEVAASQPAHVAELVQPSALKDAELAPSSQLPSPLQLASDMRKDAVPGGQELAGDAQLGNLKNFGAIDLKHLSSVSFGGDDSRSLIAGSLPVDKAQQRPALIEPSVKHVWMAASSQELPAKLKALDSALELKPAALSVANGGSLNVSYELSRRQAVALVKALKASGFELLSPQQPQPEQNVFSGSGNEPVNYEASFVVKQAN